MSLLAAEQIAEGAAFVAVLSVGWVALGRDHLLRRRAERRGRKRARQTEAVAVEASLEVEAFAPEVIREAVDQVVDSALTAWHADVRSRPSPRKDSLIIARWAHNHRIGPNTRIDRPLTVDLLRVMNRDGESEDRVVIRLRTVLHAGQAKKATDTRLDERWTLSRDGGTWKLVEFDDTPLSDELLASPQVVGAWADQRRLREHSLVDLAQAEPAASGPPSADLRDVDADPMHQLLDLSVIDSRYLPDLIQEAVVHLLEVWEHATTGATELLAERVSREALEQLLYPHATGGRLRLVLRDAHLTSWQPIRVDGQTNPPQVEISLNISAVRYLTDPVTANEVWGSAEHPHEISLRWNLALTPSSDRPWQLAQSTNPAADIPGAGP